MQRPGSPPFRKKMQVIASLDKNIEIYSMRDMKYVLEIMCHRSITGKKTAFQVFFSRIDFQVNINLIKYFKQNYSSECQAMDVLYVSTKLN